MELPNGTASGILRWPMPASAGILLLIVAAGLLAGTWMVRTVPLAVFIMGTLAVMLAGWGVLLWMHAVEIDPEARTVTRRYGPLRFPRPLDDFDRVERSIRFGDEGCHIAVRLRGASATADRLLATDSAGSVEAARDHARSRALCAKIAAATGLRQTEVGPQVDAARAPEGT